MAGFVAAPSLMKLRWTAQGGRPDRSEHEAAAVDAVVQDRKDGTPVTRNAAEGSS